MIYTHLEILRFAFRKLCKIQFDEIRNRYPHKAWILLILRTAYDELEKSATEDYLVNHQMLARMLGDKDNRNCPHKLELYGLVCDLKTQLEPIDYLFLKAAYASDDRETEMLFEQMLFMAPENVRLLLISVFIRNKYENADEAYLANLQMLARMLGDQDNRNFVQLIILLNALLNGGKVISARETVALLRSMRMPWSYMFSLIYHISQINAVTAMAILDKLEISPTEKHWIYRLVKANIFYELREFKLAEKCYTGLDINNALADESLRLEVLYKNARSLKETGQDVKSVLLLQEIVFNDDYIELGSDYFLFALTDLARYYVDSGKAMEVDKVIARLEYVDIEYLEALLGEDYLLLMAERLMLDCEYSKALGYYKKAYAVNGNEEIQQKIHVLENHGGS